MRAGRDSRDEEVGPADLLGHTPGSTSVTRREARLAARGEPGTGEWTGHYESRALSEFMRDLFIVAWSSVSRPEFV